MKSWLRQNGYTDMKRSFDIIIMNRTYTIKYKIKKYIFRLILTLLPAFAAFLFSQPGVEASSAARASSSRWTLLKKRYGANKHVNRLIFVKYKGHSKADFLMFKKTKGGRWKRLIRCTAYVGKNGIGKQREGDKKTPTGTFNFTIAFGILKNPGTGIRYIKLNPYLYWSSRKKDYNRMVDSRKARGVRGEHLIRCNPYYNYAINIDYNPDNIYGKGSAIFLHCQGGHPYTGGCVAIPQKKMRKVLKNATSAMKICIYRK